MNTKQKYLQLLKIPTDWQVDHFRPDKQATPAQGGEGNQFGWVAQPPSLLFYLACLLSLLVSVERATRVLWKVKFSNIYYWRKMKSNKRVLLAVRLTSLLERNSRRVCEIGVGIFGEGKYLDHMYEVDPYVYLPTIVNKLLSLEIRVVVRCEIFRCVSIYCF